MLKRGRLIIEDRTGCARVFLAGAFLVLPGGLWSWIAWKKGDAFPDYLMIGGVAMLLLGLLVMGLTHPTVLDRGAGRLERRLRLFGVPIRRRVSVLGSVERVVLRPRTYVTNPHDHHHRQVITHHDLFLVGPEGERRIDNGGEREQLLELGREVALYLGVEFEEQPERRKEPDGLGQQPLRLKLLVGVAVVLLIGGFVAKAVLRI